MEESKGAILSERQRVGLTAVSTSHRVDPVAGQLGPSIYGDYLKRVIDVVLAVASLPLLIPVFLILALFVRRDGGPLFYRHARVGRDGELFDCLKIRTMVMGSEQILQELLDADPKARAEWNETFKLRDDPRITRIGRVLRKTSLDELPQIINVLKGDMSIVGPRPITQDELDLYGDLQKYYIQARPGLTGPWQVTGRRENDFKSRAALDADYVKNVSFLSDMYYLLATVPEMIFCRGR